MIRVLQVGLSSNPGGVENLVLNYNRNIDNNTCVFDYLDIYSDGIAFEEEIVMLGGRIHTLPSFKKRPISFIKRYRKILKYYKYDIVHVHLQSCANILTILVPYMEGIKVVGHSHSSSTSKGFFRNALHIINRKILKYLHIKKWACGETASFWMWGKTENYEIIPNAVNFDKYVFNENVRKEKRRQCEFDADNFVIGFVGRFGEEKNTFFLLDVLKSLLCISDKYRLLTVGGGGLYEEFKQKVKDFNLQKYVISVGICDDASEWYQAMDAFLLPSYFEGFPMVGVEAQISGLSCYFSENVSREINISGESIFLSVENGADGSWAKYIDQFSTSFHERDVKVDSKYRINVAAEMLVKKYKEIMEE